MKQGEVRPRCLPGNVEGKQCMTGAARVRENGAGNRPAGNACLEGLGNSLSHLKEVGLRTTTKKCDGPLSCPEEIFRCSGLRLGHQREGLMELEQAGGAKLHVQQGRALEVRDA